MAQHTPKVPMQDEEIKMHLPACADFTSFRAGIRCAERIYNPEELIRQVNHFTDEWSDACNDHQSSLNRIAELTRELEEARKDAARYRCLKQTRPVLLLTGFFGNGCVNRTIDEVDAAIDAAIKEQT